MKLVPEPLLKRFRVEKEKKWRSDLVNAGQGGHDARHVDTVGDGNTGSSADAASNRDDHRPAAQSDPPESPTEGPWK